MAWVASFSRRRARRGQRQPGAGAAGHRQCAPGYAGPLGSGGVKPHGARRRPRRSRALCAATLSAACRSASISARIRSGPMTSANVGGRGLISLPQLGQVLTVGLRSVTSRYGLDHSHRSQPTTLHSMQTRQRTRTPSREWPHVLHAHVGLLVLRQHWQGITARSGRRLRASLSLRSVTVHYGLSWCSC